MRFDKEGFIRYWLEQVQEALELALINTIEITKARLYQWLGSNREAPSSWVQQLIDSFGEMSISLNGNSIELEVELMGYDNEADNTRYNVLKFGTGEIWTKPGEETWHGGSTPEGRPGSKQTSNANARYHIPQFEHGGYDWENEFEETLERKVQQEIQRITAEFRDKNIAYNFIIKE